jgi:hypothetical protein
LNEAGSDSARPPRANVAYVYVNGKLVEKELAQSLEVEATPAAKSWRARTQIEPTENFKQLLDQRSELGLRFVSHVSAEMDRISADTSLSPEKRIALLGSLSLMIASGRAERIYGTQMYMHLTGQELPPTKGARTLAAKVQLKIKQDAARAAAAPNTALY